MQKYLIDCGAHNGKAIKSFMATKKDASDYIIHAFEPNPYVSKNYGDNVIVHNEAVWVEDGTVSLYVTKDKKGSPSATLYKKKKTGRLDRKHPKDVSCIDFSRWLNDTVNSEDYVIVKMNMEGAEYPVLEKMIEDTNIGLVDVLYVKFHAKKIKHPLEDHNKLLARLMKFPLKLRLENL